MSASTLFHAEMPSLRWSGCNSGIIASAGDLFLPGNSALPATPATITITPEQWTNNTTIEIHLDVAQGGINQSSTLTANLDEISLTGVPNNDLIFAHGFE